MIFSLQGFIFIFLTLCTLFNLSVAIPYRSVLAPEIKGQIDACDRACQAYRTSFRNFLISMTMEDWNIAKKDFSTCQWRCYRCTLNSAIFGMEYIENETEDFVGVAANLRAQQNIIIPAINDCIRKWELSAVFGCDKNPVESYTSACVLY